ncbi:hypothetical protein PPACK8108_LOCUS13321, partial [Phakopsora pachyrhizi]
MGRIKKMKIMKKESNLKHEDEISDGSDSEGDQTSTGNIQNSNQINSPDINNENLEISNQDTFIKSRIKVITKKVFLENVALVNQQLSNVIDNPNIPTYIHGKVKKVIESLLADEQKVTSGEPLPLTSNIKIETPGLVNKRKLTKDNNKVKKRILVDGKGLQQNSHNVSSESSQLMVQPLIPASVNKEVLAATVNSLNTSITPFTSQTTLFPPSCLFLKHGDHLCSILADGHLTLQTWKRAMDLIVGLIFMRKTHSTADKLATHLPSGIQFKSDGGVTITQWLNSLEETSLNLFLAKVNEPFFSEDIINTEVLYNSQTSIGHLPKHVQEIVQILQPLSNPSHFRRTLWANLLFESINLVSREVTPPATFNPQNATDSNPLAVETALAGFLGSCFSFNKKKAAVLSIEGNPESSMNSCSRNFKNLDDFVDRIIHLLLALNMVRAHAKCGEISAENGEVVDKSCSTGCSSINSLQDVHKKIGVERPLYCLLMAFCCSGVRGLMLCSENWRLCGARQSLQ